MFYVVLHEGGHCIMEVLAGGRVNRVDISPLGMGGVTNADILGTAGLNAAFYASGMAATSLCSLAMARKQPLLSLIFAVRTLVYSLSFTGGSDIQMAGKLIGSYVWPVMAAIAIADIVAIVIAMERLDITKKARGTISSRKQASFLRAQEKYKAGKET